MTAYPARLVFAAPSEHYNLCADLLALRLRPSASNGYGITS